MQRRIISFDTDILGHWRAWLECGHPQHMRHDPPLISRSWVLTADGRESRIGQTLDCVRCDRGEPSMR